jgi:hypothetical protein
MPGDAIKEQVVQKILDMLTLIAGEPYNTDFNGQVYRAQRNISIPAISIYVGTTATVDNNEQYTDEIFDMPISIEALTKYEENGADAVNFDLADKQSIKVESDIYETLFARAWRMTFTNSSFAASTDENDLIGVTMPGGIGGQVFSFLPASPWAPAQAGSIDIIRVVDEDLWSAGAITIGPMNCTGVTFTEIDLDISPADKIELISTGIETYPATVDDNVTTKVDIIVRFKHIKGNPYAQTA